jgi:hypothetical protein
MKMYNRRMKKAVTDVIDKPHLDYSEFFDEDTGQREGSPNFFRHK